MPILIFIFMIFNLALAEVPIPRAATGLEAGVARLSDGHKSVIGTSWVYVFEYQADPYVSFFGQAGNSQGEEDGFKINQTSFNGGIELYILPRFGFQLGLSNNVIKIEDDQGTHKKEEMGPMVGANIYYPLGIFLIGTSATVIRTNSFNSTALRGMVLIEI